MAQAVRQTQKKPEAYWQTIQRRMNVGACIKVFNEYIEKKHDDHSRARLAWDAMSAMMPRLQAIAVQIEDNRPQTRDDIAALLTTTGLKPEQVWAALTARDSKESVDREIIEHKPDDPEGAPTQDDGA